MEQGKTKNDAKQHGRNWIEFLRLFVVSELFLTFLDLEKKIRELSNWLLHHRWDDKYSGGFLVELSCVWVYKCCYEDWNEIMKSLLEAHLLIKKF